ncbi:MAG TPA: J domain-containing protein [Pyrinomonadaceae bacterium]|nr:J domain-containing protein [Pyrinomonadaceae bacterium]
MGFEDEKDYYATLGADEDASQGDIERLYKRLAVRHHPDRGGDEEQMKSLNEAYRVLGDREARHVYDSERRAAREEAEVRRSGLRHAGAHAHTGAGFVPHSSPAARADMVGGRIIGAWLCVLAGLVLLLLVRFHYVRFLWPLALLAGAVVLMGVLMAHGALSFARRSAPRGALFTRFVWAQEFLFWGGVGAGVYGVYLLLTAI